MRRRRTEAASGTLTLMLALALITSGPAAASADDGGDPPRGEKAPSVHEARDDEAAEDERAPPLELTRKQRRANRLRLVDDLEVLPGAMSRTIGIPKGRGFWYGSPDRQYIVRMSTFLHIDQRSAWSLGSGDGSTDRLFFRRSRAAVEGAVFGNLDYRALFDLSIGLMPVDVYLDYRAMPELNVRVGKFKSPFGFERRARSFALVFTERGLSTRLAPNRDFGVFVHGQTQDGFFSYDVAMLGGAADHESIDFFRGTPEFAGRIYVQPFRLTSRHAKLKHLGLGFSTTVGKEEGSAEDSRLSSIATAFGSRFFEYRSGEADEAAFADGTRFRWSLHGHYRFERWNTMFEYIESTQRVRLGDSADSLTNRAWMAYVSVALTDDVNGFFGINPARPFAPRHGRYGGFSLAVRYHELYVDEGAFSIFADPGVAARGARSGTVSLQWHVNIYLEAQLDLEYVRFQGGSPHGGNRDGELAIFFRLEPKF